MTPEKVAALQEEKAEEILEISTDSETSQTEIP
jgi:hypothetical protein